MKSNARLSAKQSVRFAREQSGYALLLVVVGLVIGSLAYLTSNLNTNSVRQSRDEITGQALAQAKEALIGRAATDENRPGSLPCPDTDNDGVADLDCTPINGAVPPNTVVGRLPWKTLGLADLRDGNGERLWYALSPAFTDRSLSQPINSNLAGQLETVDAMKVVDATPAATASGIVAIVFAPGSAIAGQSRTPANENLVSQYLEGENNYLNDAANGPLWSNGAEINNGVFTALPRSDTFNDQLILIRSEDLFPVVENVVARRIQHEIVPAIEAYRKALGSYPDATPTNKVSGFLPTAALDAYLTLPNWFTKNEWDRQVYYRISSGFSEGKSSCDASSCLSVLVPGPNIRSARMVLVLAGRPLTSTQVEARAPEPPKLAAVPPATMNGTYLSFFFEEENNELASSTPPYDPLVFDGRPRTPTRNDKVIYVDSGFYPPLGQPAGPVQTSRIHVAPEQGFIEYE